MNRYVVMSLTDLLRHLHRTSGDQAAWEEVANRVRTLASRQAHPKMIRSVQDVEDIVQGILLKLQLPDHLEAVTTARFPPGYIVTMIANASRDLIRRRLSEDEALTTLGFKFVTPQHEGDYSDLERELAALSNEDRELLRLRFWDNLSFNEIAERLGLSYWAVTARAFRILKDLRERLGAENRPPE